MGADFRLVEGFNWLQQDVVLQDLTLFTLHDPPHIQEALEIYVTGHTACDGRPEPV